ncbi:hypothetical protein JX265_009770 [Neoarthrinium moseri]|uniref:Uncharacterized protein n=1 Tax=Neoarthrinium moseri TaxID=1658444 RepID=A0A9P9WFZ5_9PEZI|nr:uncharacterized protein JN550_012175 [Neoarthrinium moseri]KAI1840875.1 hypothetical protein JX266_012957 [Neoarthrinium moseri]KAI1859255.1 hypothetical protein JN550_012175 [Neoarthrinium moseri]KAI1861151.1 hypothetical protein JX265_009770 [Neoarthrinium moseri]
MLDENLPIFFTRPSSDNSLSTPVYFTQNGSEPLPEYAYRRPNPAAPESKNKFAVALADATNQDVIYGEVLIEPDWQQPTLSAAEIRAQNGVPPPLVPMIPDSFTIQLYNPDQQIVVKGEKSTWTGKESWEFEIPQQSFKPPSTSKLDQEQQTEPLGSILTPKVMFRWKRDSKFSKDMTCYMTGTALGKQKNKDPDITVAMFRQGRNPGLTIYEPNLNRVEVEDRKGFEVALLLGAEAIREIYLFPNRESFNLAGAPPNKRKNSRPLPGGTPPKTSSPVNNPYAMSGGLGNAPPAQAASAIPAKSSSTPAGRNQADVDAETKRLQALVQKEERERERRDKEEQKRIKRMLDEEEKERQRQQAEVAKETERLKREYGMAGQDYEASRPNLPPRPSGQANGRHPQASLQPPGALNPPPRPVSAGPSHSFSNWFHGPGVGPAGPPPQPHVTFQQPQSSSGRRRGESDGGNKIQKKRSVFF